MGNGYGCISKSLTREQHTEDCGFTIIQTRNWMQMGLWGQV